MLLHTLEADIKQFIQNSEYNLLEDFNNMQIFDNPLINIAGASDTLWEELKKSDVVGPDHLTPNEWLPGSKSVISYFLPFTKQIRSSNRLEGPPSQKWLYGRIEGEILNNALRHFIVDFIETSGGKAMAPALDKRFLVSNHISNWSERHVAFIAGLGTFSLSYSLITNLGTAGRFGSVITDKVFETKSRPYQEVDEYCTKCGVCIERCPQQAITENIKDKECCFQYLMSILELNKPRYGCGKCQTAVPCEYENPTKR